MILNSGRNLLAIKGTGSKIGLKAIDGTVNNSLSQSTVISYFAYASLLIGDGTTPVNADDYNMDNDITNSFTVTIASKSDLAQDKTYENANNPLYFINALVSNDGETDIEIKELGILIKSTATAPNSSIFLLTRKVLSDALVIEAGKTYQIRVEIN